MAKKNIIVGGGGGAGVLIARALSQQLSPEADAAITLIETREFYVHYLAALRMLVTSSGDLEDKILIPYDELFVNNSSGVHKVVHATVSSIHPNKSGTGSGFIKTQSGQELSYDALVLSPGSIRDGPLNIPPSKPEALTFIRSWRKKIEQAKKIIIVGGGPVGSELAGEIRDAYPDKSISIAHRQNHLLSGPYPDKFRADVDKRWQRRNVELLLNKEISDAEVESPEDTSVLIIPTRTPQPNTEFVKTLGDHVVKSKTGLVSVDKHLQLPGYPGIFAAGDVIDWNEVKQVFKYTAHTTAIVANVKAHLEGKPALVQYKPVFEGIFLSNGMNGGAAYVDVLWGLHFETGSRRR